MEKIIRSDKLEITESINEYINKKLGKIEKYLLKENVKISVMIKYHKDEAKVEITLISGKNIMRAEEYDEDLYSAIDKTIDKLIKQLRKLKNKLQDHKKKSFNEIFAYDQIENEPTNENKITRIKEIEMVPISIEEAELQIELLNHDFYLFKDSSDDEIKLLYKRKDGNYGLLTQMK